MKKKHSFWIVNSPNKKSLTLVNKIEKTLLKNNFLKAEKEPDFLFVVGGDGTFVNSIRDYYSLHTKIIGINSGTLGFYSNFSFENLKNFEKKILEKKNYIEPWIIEVIANEKKYFAINEIVVSSLSTLNSNIFISDAFYQKYKGSGIAICTKTGSTGYCKNIGGAIIMPDVEAYEMNEIAPTVHSKNVSLRSPVILSCSTTIKLTQITSNQPTQLIVDGLNQQTIEKNGEVSIRVIKPKCKLFFPGTRTEYIKKLQKAFIKGK